MPTRHWKPQPSNLNAHSHGQKTQVFVMQIRSIEVGCQVLNIKEKINTNDQKISIKYT
jgi:hypothetical protein